MVIVLLTIALSDPLATFWLPRPTTLLCSSGLETLVLEEKMLVRGNITMVLLNRKLRFNSGHFDLLIPLNEQSLTRITEKEYQEESGLLVYNEEKGEYSWSAGDLLGNLLILVCPIINVNEKL